MLPKLLPPYARPVFLAALIVSAIVARSIAQPSTAPSTRVASTLPSTVPSTQAAATTEPSPEVRSLVDDLGSDSYNTREAAQKKLIARSDSAAPELRGALNLDLSEEARERLLSILHKIDDNHRLGPSVITMHYKDAPMQDVLNDFAIQSQADLGVHRTLVTDFAKDKRITVDLDRANFWQALRMIHDRTGLQPQLYSNESRMVLDPNAGNAFDLFSDRMVVSGPFAIIPESCQENRNVSYARNANQSSSLTLMLIAVAEPKLKIVNGATGRWLEECVDDKKHSLIPENAQMPIFYNNVRQWWWQLQTNLREVPDIGAKISTLKGTLNFSVQMKSEKIEIDNVLTASNVTRTAGNYAITLRQVTLQNNMYQVQMIFSNGQTSGWEQVQGLAQSMQVLDEKGEPMQQNGMSTSGSPGRFEVTMMYSQMNFNGGPPTPHKPDKLIWEVATELKPISVPFQIDDLELPHAPH
jgi:hypothetical protein